MSQKAYMLINLVFKSIGNYWDSPIDLTLKGGLVNRLADKFPPGNLSKVELVRGELVLFRCLPSRGTYKKMYIPDRTYSPTLRPKGAQKPSN